MNHFWRLSEAGPNNLGLACTDDGLLLGHTSLIERRGDRFVVRERGEIELLLKRAYHGQPPVDRLMGGMATVASALNANDQCLARIAAVHLKIPDLPSAAARDAMAAEDSLIKYARDESSGGANWNPALHPRTGAPPNPGWFAPTDGHGESSRGESRLQLAETQDDLHRTDATPTGHNDRVRPPPDYHIGEPASFDDVSGSKDQRGASDFWSNVRAAISNWLQEPVPEYDIEGGRVVGERPRWRAIAPYVGIPAATAVIFGGEAAGLPAVLSALGLGGNAAETAAGTTGAASEAGAIISSIAQEQANPGISGLSRYISANQLRAYLANPATGSRFLGTAVHNATARVTGNALHGSFYI